VAASFTLTGSLRIQPRWVDSLNTTDVTDSATAAYTFAFADGTAANQANGYFKDVVTVAAATTTTLTMATLPLKAFGGTGTLNLAAQKLILVRNLSTTISVTVALGSLVTAALGPEGVLYVTRPATGWAAATLTIQNAGASAADVEIYLVGVKA
jgi:hypothetical protein